MTAAYQPGRVPARDRAAGAGRAAEDTEQGGGAVHGDRRPARCGTLPFLEPPMPATTTPAPS
ncbi:hypothetical protein ACE1SV_52120 [Streptomyces sp. E-15]